MADPARIDQTMRSVSRSLPALVARIRPRHQLHPPLATPKVMVANHPEAMLVFSTTSLSEIMNTHKMSWRPAIPNIRAIPRWTTIASLLRQSNLRPPTLHPHLATILNPTVVPFPSTCHPTPHLQQKASIATTLLPDSANPHPAQPQVTTTTTSKSVLSTAKTCQICP